MAKSKCGRCLAREEADASFRSIDGNQSTTPKICGSKRISAGAEAISSRCNKEKNLLSMTK